jgi:hypothetical protein
MLSLIGAATSEPPVPTPFLTLIATCRPVQMGDFGIGSVIIGEREAMRCWQAGQNIAKGVRYLHYDQARRQTLQLLFTSNLFLFSKFI